MSYMKWLENYSHIKDTNTRNALADLRHRLVGAEHRITKTGICRIPVVRPDGQQCIELDPDILEYRKVFEERTLSDVVRWLEEMLECKFQVIRTPDEEGGYDTSD